MMLMYKKREFEQLHICYLSCYLDVYVIDMRYTTKKFQFVKNSGYVSLFSTKNIKRFNFPCLRKKKKRARLCHNNERQNKLSLLRLFLIRPSAG